MSANLNETLSRALLHHRRGELYQAGHLYREVLLAQPNHPDALHLFGLAFLQGGDTQNAIYLISRAVSVMPGAAVFHASLAEAYRSDKQFDRAINCCRLALQQQANYPEVHNTLGLVQLDQGRAAQALPHLHEAIRLRPEFALAHNNLGNAYRLLGDDTPALSHFRRAVELDGHLAIARGNLGQMLLDKKLLAEALEHAQVAVRLQPTSAPAHSNLGNVLRDMGRLPEAKAAYAEALRLSPNLAMAHNNMGQAVEEEGALDEAIRWYQQAINLEPNTTRFHLNLGSAYREKDETDKAAACYQTALRLDPEYAEAHCSLGSLAHDQGRFDEAKVHYRAALRLKPDLAPAHCSLSKVLEELNDLSAAERHLREALRHEPRCPRTYAQLATLLRGKLPGADVQTMQQLAADPLLPEGKRSALLFGLAQVHDAHGGYERAGEHLRQANALDRSCRTRRSQGWNPDNHIRFVDRILATFTPELFERMNGWGLDSERPVFIFGLPRSGTTLIEQVLASHARVFGAGELRHGREAFEALAAGGGEPECLAALENLDDAALRRIADRHLTKLRVLDDAADRVTDKMPDNYMYLGLLSLLFPQAKFIHCRRDLRDTAVSCWITHFRQIRWANDLEHIAVRFREYRRLMDHWSAVLPAPLLEIDYEETVADLEGVARRLVSWCDLEWDPACLEFHRTDRPIRTASVTQVRQPVYQRSVARWKHYEPTLGPLFRQLEALEARDLVESRV